MSMELKGKVLQLLPLQSGMGKKGQWKKQEFILETQTQYPKKVCLSVWGDKIDQYKISVGDVVTASLDIESREYNGRWYTEARAWKLERNGPSTTSAQSADPIGDEPFVSNQQGTDDLPF